MAQEKSSSEKRTFRVAVCESPAELVPGSKRWRALVSAAKRSRADVLVLNEMPFGRWLASDEKRNDRLLAQSHKAHDKGMEALGALGVPIVVGSRARMNAGRSVNEGFLWTPETGVQATHTKQFFPNEKGYYEARWYERGEIRFRMAEVRGLRIGFMICTDIWFQEWARHYGRKGAHLIVVPRSTPKDSLPRWKIGITSAAIVSGCYVASSNRAGRDSRGQVFGGHGWIVDPTGKMLAETKPGRPIAVAKIDLSVTEAAKKEYPRYVDELRIEGGEERLAKRIARGAT